MKKALVPVFGLLFMLGTISCKKDAEPAKDIAPLEVSKTGSVRKGEPVVFALSDSLAGNVVEWHVRPATNVQINPDGNKASILFGQKGNYTVIAVSGDVVGGGIVSVSDTVYTGDNGGTTATALPLTADEVIKITVSRIDSISSSGLIFSAQTTNTYACLGNSLISETHTGTGSFTINYTGVNVPAGCAGGTAKAGGFNYLYTVGAGSTTLTINVNGTNYTGTIVKTGNSYTINWPDTEGVIIHPTSL